MVLLYSVSNKKYVYSISEQHNKYYLWTCQKYILLNISLAWIDKICTCNYDCADFFLYIYFSASFERDFLAHRR